MNKAYQRTEWENYPSDKSPINERNLNNIEAGVDEIDNRVIVLDNTKATKVEVSPLFKEVEYNEQTGIITFTRKNGATVTIDTPMEKIALNIYYDPVTEMLTLPLVDGTQMQVDLSRLITEYEFLDSETIAFSVNVDGEITAIVKEGSIEEKHLRPDYLAEIKVEAGKAETSAANALKSETNAKTSEEEAKKSQDAAKLSETNAATSEVNASGSADTATEKADEAAASAAEASSSAGTATEKADEAADSASSASTSANMAAESASQAYNSANMATEKAGEAYDYATEAESFARGGTGTRPGENEDNAMEYARQAAESAKKAEDIAGGNFIPNSEKGSAEGVATLDTDGKIPIEQIPEGVGAVTGVKGQNEEEYRKGDVNLTPYNINAVPRYVTGFTISGVGWYRVCRIKFSSSNSFIFSVDRGWGNGAPEGFSIFVRVTQKNASVGSDVHIVDFQQISARSANKLIDKIRVVSENRNHAISHIDIHYSSNNANGLSVKIDNLSTTTTGDYPVDMISGEYNPEILESETVHEYTIQAAGMWADYATKDKDGNVIDETYFTKTEGNELKKSVSDGKAMVANAVTAKGVTTATDAAFSTIATNISKISTGVDTSDATATEPNVLAGKTYYAGGEKRTGTMPENGSLGATLKAGESYNIPSGHTTGGKVTASSLASQTVSDASSVDILKDKTAWVNGIKVTGAIDVLGSYEGAADVINVGGTLNHYTTFKGKTSRNFYIQKGKDIGMAAQNKTLANAIGLTAEKILKGNTILGIAGIGEGGSGKDVTVTGTTTSATPVKVNLSDYGITDYNVLVIQVVDSIVRKGIPGASDIKCITYYENVIIIKNGNVFFLLGNANNISTFNNSFPLNNHVNLNSSFTGANFYRTRNELSYLPKSVGVGKYTYYSMGPYDYPSNMCEYTTRIIAF